MTDPKRTRSSRSTLEDANEEHRLWKEICIALMEFDRIQKRIAFVLREINTILSTTDFDQGIPANLADQLKQYYAEGIELSMKELNANKNTSEKLSVLIALREASQDALDPQWKRRRRDDGRRKTKKRKT
ncbi:hypothetical protein O0I10_011123 [Lichtheimia ornata]|uniref:Uncharacterized protein n=1 Tax=Lichtheimia ornata TaxID=688661 RepID=A0AAD7UU37_9FUNG|nr:uncharacterized protein O0I10_011123 [Lichtheimia ornata]KAJ8653275.1 hypothetical protein O0I10_011123 [Lichtheimia ornata]